MRGFFAELRMTAVLRLVLTGAFGADNVFAIEALAHGDAGFAGYSIVGMDGLKAVTLLSDVEDVAPVGPGGRDLGRKVWLGWE